MNIVNSTNIFFNSVFSSAVEVINQASYEDYKNTLIIATATAAVGICYEVKTHFDSWVQDRITPDGLKKTLYMINVHTVMAATSIACLLFANAIKEPSTHSNISKEMGSGPIPFTLQ